MLILHTDEGSDTFSNEDSMDLAIFDVSSFTDIRGLPLGARFNDTPFYAITYRATTDYSSPYPYRLVTSQIIIDGSIGNFLLGHASPMLVRGDSGCPLIQDEHYVGLLCAGEVGTDRCAFLSAKTISLLLDR